MNIELVVLRGMLINFVILGILHYCIYLNQFSILVNVQVTNNQVSLLFILSV